MSLSPAPVLAPASPIPGILLALGGAVLFSANDMLFKVLSGDYALHQITAVRSVVAVAFLLALALAQPAGLRFLRSRRLPRHALRALIALGSNAFYFLGLAAMPLADAVAIAFSAPVFISVFSVFLGEKVGRHRMGAVVIGLIGTVILMRPGGEGTALMPALFILLSAVCYAASQLMARSMRDTESALGTAFFLQSGFLIGALVIGLLVGDGKYAGSDDPSFAFMFRAWIWPPMADWPYFLGTGLLVSLASLMLTQAYRSLDAAVVAPFEYAAIPMAIFWGFLIFGTLPDGIGLFGMALVVSAGLYTLWRETRRKAP